MHRALGWVLGGGRLFMSEVPLYLGFDLQQSGERIFIELMTLDRYLRATRMGSR